MDGQAGVKLICLYVGGVSEESVGLGKFSPTQRSGVKGGGPHRLKLLSAICRDDIRLVYVDVCFLKQQF